jgi:outer membrane protein
MRMKWIISLLALIWVQPIIAQDILSLQQAYTIALENNFAIRIASNEKEIAKLNNSAGAAGMLPNVNATANQDNQTINVQQKFLNGNENNRDGAKSKTLNAGVELSWTIFDGMRMFATKARLAELEAIGSLRMKQQMEQVINRVSRAYYDAVLSKAQVKTAQIFLQISEKRMEVAKAKVSSGKSAKSETLKAQVYYNSDYALLKRLQTQYLNSKLSLNQLMGKDLNFNYEVIDTLLPNANINYEELKSKALELNTGLQIAKANKDVNLRMSEEVRSERLPSLALRGGYTYSTLNSEAGFLQNSTNNGYHYGAGLSWNLYNGNDVNRRSSTAKINFKSSDYVYQDSLIRLNLSLTQAYNIYKTNIELWQFEEDNLEVAKQNFEIARDQNEVGMITSNDLREAQVILLQNVNRLLEAAHAAKVSEFELLRLSGTILTQ